jgi:D-aminopeptidase
MCYSVKGGIGTSSRCVQVTTQASYTVGVLVQTNFGSMKELLIMGVPVGLALAEQEFLPNEAPQQGSVDDSADGSLMVVLATDAPLGGRQLRRLGLRALLGIGRTNAGAISVRSQSPPQLRQPRCGRAGSAQRSDVRTVQRCG